jgi:hypothetical protein
MLEFRQIQLSDREWINSLLKKSDFMGCEYSFANNMAWRRLYNTNICRYKDFYISCSCKEGSPVFTFPAGEGDYRDLFKVLRGYAESKNSPLVVSSVTNQMLELLNELFPGEFEARKDEDSFDYIYYAKDLIGLSGKKYHQKRNHLARFYENNWSFEPLSEKNFDECIEFSVHSYNNKNGYDDASMVAEQFAINVFFEYFEQLELKGGLIRVDGRIEGFSIGEKINSNTFCVHIEKANAEIRGAYAAINNEFAKYAASDCVYINREEDLGIEGLRKAKHSYHPCFLLEKSIVTFK